LNETAYKVAIVLQLTQWCFASGFSEKKITTKACLTGIMFERGFRCSFVQTCSSGMYRNLTLKEQQQINKVLLEI